MTTFFCGVIRRDLGFVFGESVSLDTVLAAHPLAHFRISFFNDGLSFSALVITVIALVSLYSFSLLAKTMFVVSGVLEVYLSWRDTFWPIDALLDSRVHRHLENRLYLRT